MLFVFVVGFGVGCGGEFVLLTMLVLFEGMPFGDRRC